MQTARVLLQVRNKVTYKIAYHTTYTFTFLQILQRKITTVSHYKLTCDANFEILIAMSFIKEDTDFSYRDNRRPVTTKTNLAIQVPLLNLCKAIKHQTFGRCGAANNVRFTLPRPVVFCSETPDTGQVLPSTG